MKIRDIVSILNAKVLCGEAYMDEDIESAFGSDMMSDALAFMGEKAVLLTGMVNAHAIRTAEMLDLRCVIFVRGKAVPEEVLNRAEELDIALLATPCTLYVSCGLLYQAGLPGCTRS